MQSKRTATRPFPSSSPLFQFSLLVLFDTLLLLALESALPWSFSEESQVESHGTGRRLAAIIHADVKGYSCLMGKDDDRTLRILTSYFDMMCELAYQHEASHAIRSGGDTLLAVFPSVREAVQCAVEMQRELKARNAEWPVGQRIEFRMGVNLGEVVEAGGQLHGEGINIAQRLEAVAEAGGICISEIVYNLVKKKLDLEYEFLGEHTFHNITEPVRVYRVLLEPKPAVPVSKEEKEELFHPPASKITPLLRPFSAHRLGLMGAVVLGVLSLALLFFLQEPSVPKPIPSSEKPQKESGLPSPPEAVGVMPFKIQAANPQLEWMGEAIRDSFNSLLSRASDLRVYAKEHLDFLVRKESATEIEVANRLGIKKMIAGSFLVIGEKLRIEAHIIDVQSGLQEGSAEVEGVQSDFFQLHKELARKILDLLKVVAPGITKSVPSDSPPASLDRLKDLMEAVGETQAVGPPREEDAPSPGSPRAEEDTRSHIPEWKKWLGVSAAWADEVPQDELTPEKEIRQVLERYRLAYEQKSLDLLENVYDTMTAAQREANIRYFQNTQNLKVTISEVYIDVRGDEAVASYTREDEFIDAQTGQNVKLDLRFTKTFVRTDDAWRMVLRRK